VLPSAICSATLARLDGPDGSARSGEVSERLKEHAWKVCIRETVSRVRIPPSPPDRNAEAQPSAGLLRFRVRKTHRQSCMFGLATRSSSQTSVNIKSSYF